MTGDTLLLAGAGTSIAGIAVLRLSWGQSQRSISLNAAGWLLLVLAHVAGWVGAGAWGAANVSLWAMGAALVALSAAAWKSPPAQRPASNRRAGMLPEADEPASIGKRIGTFLIVTLGGLISAIALAVATRWLSLLCGGSEADANVLALFALPLGWTILVFLLLMTDSRKRQIAILTVPVTAALPALATGSLL